MSSMAQVSQAAFMPETCQWGGLSSADIRGNLFMGMGTGFL